MNPRRHPSTCLIITGLVAALALATFTPTAHANVYATDIKINGTLAGSASVAQGSGATITYILNEPASLGVAVQILSGATLVRTISINSGPGTTRGLNTVIWDGKNNSSVNVPPGTYSVQIIAQATGYASWTQISKDTDPGQAAHYPYGMDVDRNTNSPYYGRVVVGCATGAGPDPSHTGLYKMNADGSVADEGWFGYAGYTTDDGGNTATGQMPNALAHESWTWNPGTIRIGEDDRIYFSDGSAVGAIVATDMQATTNQIVITGGTYQSLPDYSHWGGPNNYQNCPEVSDLDVSGDGVRQFDVCGTGTNAAIYLVDYGDFPSWGVWMWHLVNGQSDTNDTVGTHCVAVGSDGDGTMIVSGSGIMVDHNLNIFVSENRQNTSDPLYRSFLYTNWNGGILPQPTNADYAGPLGYAVGTGASPVAWEAGSADDYMSAIFDTVIDSRDNPTLVAVAMVNGAAVSGGYNGKNGGIRLLNATNGAVVVTNLDIANWYNGVAFDKVGNVYGCSRSTNVWRVWSPPGANQATTPAAVTLTVTTPPTLPHITNISVSSGTVTIKFTGAASDPASAFALLSSGTVNGTYNPAVGAVLTGSAGSYTATAPTSGGAQFYRIRR